MERNFAFPASRFSQVRLKLTWAQLEIDDTNTGEIQVIIAGDDESVEELRVEELSEGLVIGQPQLLYAKEILPRRRWLQIALRLPGDWRGELDAGTVAGTVGARNIGAQNVSINSVSGAINVREIKADLIWLHTVAGAIAGSALTADRANLRSISGGITLADAAFGTTKLFTVSGTAQLGLLPGSRTLDVQSVSGPVAIETDGPVIASLHSLSGQFTISDAVPQGAGGLEISASSVSAGLSVGKRKG